VARKRTLKEYGYEFLLLRDKMVKDYPDVDFSEVNPLIEEIDDALGWLEYERRGGNWTKEGVE
jgi:hypothetical protein